MAGSQALMRSAVQVYSSATVQGWRSRLSAMLLPFWPKADDSTLPVTIIVERARAVGETWQWRRLAGRFDLDAGSGALFAKGRMLRRTMLPASTVMPAAPVDLTAYLGGKVIPREPALVLYNGADSGFGAFTADFLPRFMALETLGVPLDMLLMTTINIGRQSFLQDALADGMFRPRPVELFRPGSVIRTSEVHEIAVPSADPELLGAIARHVAALYGPFRTDGPPIFLCEAAGARAQGLLARLDAAECGFNLASLVVVDPLVVPLGETVRRIAAAPLVVGTPRGELAAILLAPRPGRRALELGPGRPRSARVAAAIGETYQLSGGAHAGG